MRCCGGVHESSKRPAKVPTARARTDRSKGHPPKLTTPTFQLPMYDLLGGQFWHWQARRRILLILHSSRPHLRRAFVDGSIAFRARQPQPFHTAILNFVGLAHFPQFAPVHFHLFTTQLDVSIGLQPAAWRRHLQNGGQASSPLLDLLG